MDNRFACHSRPSSALFDLAGLAFLSFVHDIERTFENEKNNGRGNIADQKHNGEAPVERRDGLRQGGRQFAFDPWRQRRPEITRAKTAGGQTSRQHDDAEELFGDPHEKTDDDDAAQCEQQRFPPIFPPIEFAFMEIEGFKRRRQFVF